MQLLMNRLHRWYLPITDKDCSIRCFSHLCTHPKDVETWVPLNLKELQGTIAFDARTCALMKGRNVAFLVHKGTDMLKAIEVV